MFTLRRICCLQWKLTNHIPHSPNGEKVGLILRSVASAWKECNSIESHGRCRVPKSNEREKPIKWNMMWRLLEEDWKQNSQNISNICEGHLNWVFKHRIYSVSSRSEFIRGHLNSPKDNCEVLIRHQHGFYFFCVCGRKPQNGELRTYCTDSNLCLLPLIVLILQ